MTTFDTSTNGTLDGNNITFPLNQPIYVDATHDTVIANSKSLDSPPRPEPELTHLCSHHGLELYDSGC